MERYHANILQLEQYLMNLKHEQEEGQYGHHLDVQYEICCDDWQEDTSKYANHVVNLNKNTVLFQEGNIAEQNNENIKKLEKKLKRKQKGNLNFCRWKCLRKWYNHSKKHSTTHYNNTVL